MGANPNETPKIIWAKEENRLKRVYPPKISSMGKASLNAKSLIKYATTINRTPFTAMNPNMVVVETRPSTEGRFFCARVEGINIPIQISIDPHCKISGTNRLHNPQK
jgi:sugar (pentulose or hexulose) kinase